MASNSFKDFFLSNLDGIFYSWEFAAILVTYLAYNRFWGKEDVDQY